MQIEKIKVGDLFPYEKNPRKNDKAVAKVANSIKEFGFINPIVVDKNNIVVAGHTRLKAALKLKLDTVPCIRVDKLSDEQVKAFRLADNKLSELAEWDVDLLEQELADIVEIDMSDFGFDDILKEEGPDNTYTKEVKIPQYEPTGEAVTLKMCVDTSKAEELSERIRLADVPKNVKEFLLMAATRHYSFNYKYIAEYYAQAPKEVQELFEDSALVIIDFEDAIAKGYVELSKTVAECISEDGYV